MRARSLSHSLVAIALAGGCGFAADEALFAPGMPDPAPAAQPGVRAAGSERTNHALLRLGEFRTKYGCYGTGQTVVILDTGARLDHDEFKNAAGASRIAYQYDFGDNDGNAADVHGHGTNVASIAAGRTCGIASDARIIVLKVFSDAGSATSSKIESALQWVISNRTTYGITAINLSLGDSKNWNANVTPLGLHDEFASLANNGIACIAASGNYFADYTSTQGVAYPAADANCIAVGAVFDSDVGSTTNWRATAYTSAADRIAPFAQRHQSLLAVLAPGVRVTGADKGNTTGTSAWTGTSQATPHVTGVIAVAQQLAQQRLGRRLTIAEIRSLLATASTVVRDGDDEDDNVVNTGLSWPRLDLVKLGDAIVGLPATPPVATFSNRSVLASETGYASVSVTRNGSSGALSVTYTTRGGTALAGSDFSARSGTLTWADGNAAAQTISVPITPDTIAEGDETFTVQLTSTTGTVLDTATVTIRDDDAASSYPLSITASNGTVTRNPNQPSYAPGTRVSLTPIANPGYVFQSWSGAVSSTNAGITVTMDGPKDLTATFARVDLVCPDTLVVREGSTASFGVSLSRNPGTTVTVNLARAANADASITCDKTALTFTTSNWWSSQTVTATAAQDGDSDCGLAALTLSANGFVTRTVAAYEQDDDGNQALSATNAQNVPEAGSAQVGIQLTSTPPAPVTVRIARLAGDTSLTVPATTLTFTSAWQAQQVAVSAAADNDDRWNGSALFAVSASGYTTRLVQATELDDDFILSAGYNNGAVERNPLPASGLYQKGTVVQLTARPMAGYVFSGWSGSLTGTQNPATVTMNSDVTVWASFSQAAAGTAGNTDDAIDADGIDNGPDGEPPALGDIGQTENAPATSAGSSGGGSCGGGSLAGLLLGALALATLRRRT